MEKELRILILEDVAADAELAEHELRKANIRFSSKRVKTKETFLKELKDFAPDLILSDHTLPSFDGVSALKMAHEKCPNIPFIFVSGTLGEEVAIETLKMGATDYVLKNRLSRLVPAVHRALQEAEERAECKQAEEDFRKNLAQSSKKNRYETIISTVTRSVHQSINLQEVLENAVESMSKNIDKADIIGIYLVEEEEAVLRAHKSFDDQYVERARRIPYPKGFTWKTIIDGKPNYCADADQDTVIGPAGRETGIKSYLCMPIRFEDKTIGTVGINSFQKNAFDEEEIKLLEIVAQEIEGAIHNAQITEALRQSEERYRTLFDQSPIGVLIFDNQFKITHCNERIVQILQSSYDKIIGFNMRKLKDQSYIPAMMKALEGQSSYYEGFYEATISTAKLWLSIRLSPLRDASGSVIGGMGVMEDITKRKQAEEKIQGQAELLDRAQDAILVRDLKHHIIYWNKGAERLYGLKEGEAIGKKVTELLYKRNTPDFEEAMKIVTVKGEWKGELHQMTKDGREVIVESRWTLVRDDERKLKSILVVNTDITEKKKIEAQFLRAQRIESIGTLAAGIAHDLNNVLSPIMTGLQLLRQKFTDEQSQNWLNILETSARRGADLVRQILSFARGQEGQRMPLQIRYLISEIEKILKEILSKSIEIHTDIPKYLWLISGDPTQLHQVLMNLCMNARDAMPNGGTLSISAENHLIDENYARMNIEAKVGPYVVLTVSDTGIGIPPEIVDRIFEPFYTTKEPGKGTGLGLSTSFGIIKSHGGFIHVHNEIGRGAQFKVYLPATETTKTHRAEEKKVELPMGQGELILAVDDEASIRAITKVTLKTNGYRVITANDGVEAIALYVQNREEIKGVILDMMMPTMDGLMTIRALRKIDPQVKIIVVSGLEEDDKIAEAIGPKVDAFLSKPYTGERLIKTLHEVFRAR